MHQTLIFLHWLAAPHFHSGEWANSQPQLGFCWFKPVSAVLLANVPIPRFDVLLRPLYGNGPLAPTISKWVAPFSASWFLFLCLLLHPQNSDQFLNFSHKYCLMDKQASAILFALPTPPSSGIPVLAPAHCIPQCCTFSFSSSPIPLKLGTFVSLSFLRNCELTLFATHICLQHLFFTLFTNLSRFPNFLKRHGFSDAFSISASSTLFRLQQALRPFCAFALCLH